MEDVVQQRRDSEALSEIVGSILQSYQRHREMSHLEGGNLPAREPIWTAVEDLLRLLFPGFLEPNNVQHGQIAERTAERVRSVQQKLCTEIERVLGLDLYGGSNGCRREAEAVTLNLLRQVPEVRDLLSTDIEAAYEGDPAARSLEEIIVAYPGLQAIAVYRLAHVLYVEGIPLVPRVMTEYAHSRTGIDIHPGARIGRRFFIDHGTGVVIGETCTIGDNVKIYQGVTLGAKSFEKDARGQIIKGTKRHPEIEDGVTIYSGATILGPVTIGRGSVVGGNVWLTRSIPPYTRIVVRPPQQIHIEREVLDFQI